MRVVKRRMLYATGVALAIAAILGSAAATLHARRIRRLERAANRIAEGEFDEPVVDLGDDELGELAAAFERMRVQLAQLDMARKEFVANASHELRTPLFSLAGFLELMADEDLDEETRARASSRPRASRSTGLTKLAADLLDLSRMDAGRLRVEQEEVVLADAARTLVDELTPLAESTGHRLVLETDERAWALADEERVLQIGRSLAVNALTHTPPGTEIVLTTALRAGRAELAVPTTGRGFRASTPSGLRPLLSRRRPACLGQRSRPRDRTPACRADGRHRGAQRNDGADDVHALVAGGGGAGDRARRFHVKTA